MYRLLPIILLFAVSCSPKKEPEEKVDENLITELPVITGRWISEAEELFIEEKELEYSFQKGTPNEGIFRCKIIELDQEAGFIAGEVIGAQLMGGDVTAAFEGDYSVFYFSNLKSTSMEVDGPQDAVISGIENIHRNDSAQHQYNLFNKE